MWTGCKNAAETMTDQKYDGQLPWRRLAHSAMEPRHQHRLDRNRTSETDSVAQQPQHGWEPNWEQTQPVRPAEASLATGDTAIRRLMAVVF